MIRSFTGDSWKFVEAMRDRKEVGFEFLLLSFLASCFSLSERGSLERGEQGQRYCIQGGRKGTDFPFSPVITLKRRATAPSIHS